MGSMCIYFALEMNIQSIDQQDSKHKNFNLIKRHIHEIKDYQLKNDKLTDIDYRNMRLKHSHQSSVYYFYEQKFKQAVETQNPDACHGYVHVKQCKFLIKKISITGSILTTMPFDIFNYLCDKIEIQRKEPISLFYNSLLFTPIPFIFIPDCDLSFFREFMMKIHEENYKERNGVFFYEDNQISLIICEPFTMVSLDLDYMIKGITFDENINCFLCGFIYKQN
ncbi:hypothetical protein EDEG_03084 [Edhazardia aedis USNM 41457]|uniref:Uncharacterized protein n=1 Tax=Edhazardia aedis (strain USNM 41457) TaxID=1003232 RepID=J8ZS21_EDHAE|nr:hypothetical protein EDEG_03084 [Edhazardia aedis USNM 41457]|eukprot:EJW02498.1 hypothetical protein EDEG_03084 [Edhazardia aedis USNM 41457]